MIARHPAFRPPTHPPQLDLYPVVREFGQHAVRAVEDAVRRWADACQQTPAEWLRSWRAEPTLRIEGNVFHLVIEPRRIGGTP